MKRILAASLAPILALAMLSGCVRDDTVYPSLGLRPAEKLGFAEPDAPPPAPLAADTTLDARIVVLDGRLKAADSAFVVQQAVADRLAKVPGARTVGTDGWLDAQSALATLDAGRADTNLLLSEVDELAGARAAQLLPDYPSLTALRDRIAEANTRQGEAIERLQRLLPGT